MTLDANGKAEIDFQVGMQPGNNYRVVATLRDYQGNFDQLQVSDASADTFVGAGNEQVSGFTGAGVASPMLTVWRKLHIEQDSMAAVPDPLPSYDQNTFDDITWGQTSTSTGQTAIDLVASVPYSATLKDDFYRDGYAWPTGGNRSSAYEIYSNTRLLADYTVTLIGEPSSAQQSVLAWNIVDDDSRGLSADNLPVLHRLNLISDSVKQKYEPAYITIVDVDELGLNPDKIVAFDLNLTDFDQTFNTSSINDEDNLAAHAKDEAFWNQLVVASYQGRLDNDADPNLGESPIDAGLNMDNVYSEKYATVFLEGARELYYAMFKSSDPDTVSLGNELLREDICKVVAHEIGHSPGPPSPDADHNEGGLMRSDYGPSDFSAKTLKRFREANSWR